MAEVIHNGERVLRWESKQRYYAARVQVDLLGDVVLALAWGGLHNDIGNSMTRVVPDTRAADAAISDLHVLRTKHAYQLISDTRD